MPVRSPVMEMEWNRLTFLHWAYEPDVVQALLPEGLEVDTFDDAAWVSLVPFVMVVKPPGFGSLPWLSTFPETNVRTYVIGPEGERGIWFFSLEASSALAAAAARVAYGLPYWFARMARETENSAEVYRTVRRQGPGAPGLEVRYRVGASRGTAEAGSLEEFLIERYLLHVVRWGAVRTVRVRHMPYPLRDVEVESVSEDLLAAGGVERPDARPLAHFSEGVDVDVLRVVGG